MNRLCLLCLLLCVIVFPECGNNNKTGELRIIGVPFDEYEHCDNCNRDNFGNVIPKLVVLSDLPVDQMRFEESECFVAQYVEDGHLTVDFLSSFNSVLFLSANNCKPLPIKIPDGVGGANKYYVRIGYADKNYLYAEDSVEFEHSDNKNISLKGSYIESVNGVTFKMIGVEGGTFMMGHVDDPPVYDNRDQGPVHYVSLDSYYIGEFEVTQKLWSVVMNSNPSVFVFDNLPVHYVSWNDVQIFFQKLDSITGKTYRLPTEAEWEYACIGGNKSKHYLYSGSDSLDDVAIYGLPLEEGNPQVVGTFHPNELGLYDMSGNVWEWCQDWFNSNYYGASAVHNPQGPSSGRAKVFRGGSWTSDSDGCTYYYRNCDAPEEYGVNIGFRIAISL